MKRREAKSLSAKEVRDFNVAWSDTSAVDSLSQPNRAAFLLTGIHHWLYPARSVASLRAGVRRPLLKGAIHMRRHVLVAGLIGALGLTTGSNHATAADPSSPVDHVSISTMIAKPKKKPTLMQRLTGFFSFGPSKEEEKAKKEAEDKKELMKSVARPIPGETTGNFRARGSL